MKVLILEDVLRVSAAMKTFMPEAAIELRVREVTETVTDLSTVAVMGFAWGSSVPMVAVMVALSYSLPLLFAEK